MPNKRDKTIGWVLSGIVILFMIMDMTMKFALLQPVIDTTRQLGWPAEPGVIHMLATLLLVSTALYAWPRTSALGAILLTGYLGGAVATHVRVGSPLFTHTLFGVYLGVLIWGGLWFRDPRIRALLPLAR